MQTESDKVIELAARPDGVGRYKSRLRDGRFEISTSGFDPNVQLVGGDPWGTPDFTGLVVPTVPTDFLTPSGQPQARFRYLFMLARAQFHVGERVRLVGMRQYASIFGFTQASEAASVMLEFPITDPMWRFPDANITWHVMVTPKIAMDRRNPLDTDSVVFRDSYAPAMLYQSLGPYVPPNAGRPWGRAIGSSLGNLHDLRFPWRDNDLEREFDIPVPAPCDVALYASVAQHDTATTLTLTTAQALAATGQDRFWAAMNKVQYGRIAGSLIFKQKDWAK